MTNREPLLSIVVPVYNAERYVEECVESLLAQTYSNIEYIFIDDCSQDGSLAVLQGVLERCTRGQKARIITHDKNRGLSATRTEGIREARGEYLISCDIDDYVEPNMARDMLAAAEACGSDIIVTSYFDKYPDRETVVAMPKGNGIDLNEIPINTLYLAVWNKMFRTAFLKDNNFIDYTDVNCWEDVAITARAYVKAAVVTRLDTPYYHYRHANDGKSLTEQRQEVRLKDQLACARFLDEWFADHGYSATYAEFLNHLKFSAKIKLLRGHKINVRQWKSTFPETNCGIMRYRFIPLKFRMAFLLAYLLPAKFTQAIADVVNRCGA